MATKLSSNDQTFLSKEQQEQIKQYKAQYEAASAIADPVERKKQQEAAHKAAEGVRAKAAYGVGYSTNASGTGYKKKDALTGGEDYDAVKAYVDDYKAADWSDKRGWTNGYDVDANMRTRANYIRQQMEANSAAWHKAKTEEDREYLHNQNKLLADLLAQNTGHSTNGVWDEKGNLMTGASYGYDPATGKWWTTDANNGYGTFVGYNQPNVYKAMKEVYGYTDDQMRDWSNNRSSLYYNFVDAATPGRNQVDERSGFSGRYAPFANGAHLALIGRGTNEVNPAAYANLLGDGFNDEQDYDMVMGSEPRYDSDGNIIKTPTAAKPNFLPDYTKQFTAYTQNGIIMPNSLQMTNPANAKATNGAYTAGIRQSGTGGLPDDMGNRYVPNLNDGNHPEEQAKLSKQWKQAAQGTGGTSGSGGTGNSLIEQMFGANLDAQKAALESAYQSNLDQLDTSATKMLDAYTEQRRQTTGQNAQDAAAWREMANAYGLNSGAIGQGALAQSNQLQTDLSTINSQQATTLEELEQQRITLGKEYQLAIQQATAENNFQMAQMLYQEAVRVEQQLVQQMQFAAQMSMQQQQLDAQNAQWAAEFAAKQAAANAAASTGGGGSPVVLTPETLGSGAYYRQVAEEAAANGQSVTDYLNSGAYKKYNIPYNQLGAYVSQAQAADNVYNYALNPSDSVVSSLWDRVSDTSKMGKDVRAGQADLIYNYANSGLISNDQKNAMLRALGLM